MNFFTRLETLALEKGSLLCVGLDPRIDPSTPKPGAALVAANRRVIAATAAYAIAFKPNLAFYEAFGPEGIAALEETLAIIPDGIPVILDAKRCDIDATAEAYASALFGRLRADAVTLSPYMGRDALAPFLKYEGRGVFLLCRTSNPDAGAFQDLLVSKPGAQVESGKPLYLEVARRAVAWSQAIGLVVAGNDLEALSRVRDAAPNAWFLAPGIGSQGGKADEAIAAGSRPDGLGVLVVAARSVAEAADPAAAAKRLRDDIERARERVLEGAGRGAAPGSFPASASSSTPSFQGFGQGKAPLKEKFIAALIETGCFKLGDFALKSGKRSPFYIDLRRLVSDPRAMNLAADAYATAAEGIAYDRIAGIPAAALPLATAASMKIGRPMVWPRMPAKEHGTGNTVEGTFISGERLLLLDDLITTGASKLEAAQILRGEGLIVEDLVVLIERGTQGRKDMEAAGIRLSAFLHVRELFASCEALGLINSERRRELEDYVDAE